MASTTGEGSAVTVFNVVSDHYVTIPPLGQSSVALTNVAGDALTLYADTPDDGDDGAVVKATLTAGNSQTFTDFPMFARSAGSTLILQL